MNLENKIAIVTGAAGGIGEATARCFVKAGARVVLVDLHESSTRALAEDIGLSSAAWVGGDVADPECAARMCSVAVERFGGLDVVFANAGIEGTVTPLVETSVEDFDRVLAVNVRGAFLAIKYGAPLVAKRGGGAIVVTSSVAGVVGSAGLGAYAASKHALLGLVKTAAIELAPKRIRVAAICPGPIENRMMRSIETQLSPADAGAVKAGLVSRVPMGRYGTNEEIAKLATFLASDDASFTTGAAFVSDGGFLAG